LIAAPLITAPLNNSLKTSTTLILLLISSKSERALLRQVSLPRPSGLLASFLFKAIQIDSIRAYASLYRRALY
jgi:hypothetical protein